MKRLFVITGVMTVLTVSGCGTYTGQGAYAGAQVGGILGSAIGGIGGGWRGSDVGTVIGTAGGAAIGAAIGHSADNARAERYAAARDRAGQSSSNGYRQEYQYNSQGDDRSGFDPSGSGDDRIYDYDDQTYNGSYSAAPSHQRSDAETEAHARRVGMTFSLNRGVEVRHARLIDDNRDGVLEAGEQAKVIFEIMNHSDRPLYDLQPMVSEISGNRRVYISPNIHIERVEPGRGVRYTATVRADRRLKDGRAVFRVTVAEGNNRVVSQAQDIIVPTVRRR